jgi:hypothetical protein
MHSLLLVSLMLGPQAVYSDSKAVRAAVAILNNHICCKNYYSVISNSISVIQ